MLQEGGTVLLVAGANTSDAVATVFETLARLYYDLALSAHPIPLAGLRRLAPISQILFGADWPLTPEAGVARNIRQLDGAGLSDDDLRAISRENALRVFPRLRRC